MKNPEIAAMLYDIADIYEILNVEWKPRAYRRAARSVESLSKDIAQMYKEGGIKALMEIPGVGPGIGAHIEEYLKTGKNKEYEKLKAKIPRGILELINIPGMGPKRAMILNKKLKISSMAQLEAAAKAGKIERLEGFGRTSADNIMKAIGIVKMGTKRQMLGYAMPIVNDIMDKLRALKEVKRISPAGSTRRMQETIGDVDILVTSSNPSKVMEFFTKMPNVMQTLAKGPTKSTAILNTGLQVDVRVLKDNEYGAAMQYFTGNKEHNIKLRQIAIQKGYKLSEYGMFSRKTGKKVVSGHTEEEIYKKLGMDWMPPEIRENRGEIESAMKHKLPRLIELKDIKGDFHMHSRNSDGINTIQQMAEAAHKLGYEYIALSDHSKSERVANGMDEKRLKAYFKEIDEANRKLKGKITIFKSSEVDILPNGEMDFSDNILKQFDIVIGSVHSGFKSPEDKMTKRIISAIENEHVDIIGHPTGRMIHRREPYAANMEKILKSAADNGKVMEVNSYPDRTDLKDIHIKSAIEKGVKLAIDTDSHATTHLNFMWNGVAQARRGWAEKKDVINTMNLKDVKKFFRIR